MKNQILSGKMNFSFPRHARLTARGIFDWRNPAV
jgi:hypothetical protein